MRTRERLARFFLSAAAASALALGNIFTLTSAFGVPVDAGSVIRFTLLAAVLFSLAYSLPKSWVWVLGLLAAGALAGWHWRQEIADGAVFTAVRIAERYVQDHYAFQGLMVVTPEPEGAGAAWLLAPLGAVLAWLTAATVCRGFSVWAVLPLSAPMLAVCLIMNTTVPDTAPFLLLAGAWLLLLLTGWARERETYLGALLYAAPAAALVLAAALLAGPETYERSPRAVDLRETLFSFLDFTGTRVTPPSAEPEPETPEVSDTLGLWDWDSSLSRVDLNRVGPQEQSSRRVMDIYAERPGPVYLRGVSFGVYEDNAWRQPAGGGSPVRDSALWLSSGEREQEVTVNTRREASILYIPQVPAGLPEGAVMEGDSYYKNTGYTVYTVPVTGTQKAGDAGADLWEAYERYARETYLQLPEGMADKLLQTYAGTERAGLLARSYLTEDIIAEEVADYVRTSAAYSLDTPAVEGGKDFALWFLRESDTGYCVHFATLATLMLRTFRVPARYVTGYLVEAEAGTWTAVRASDAHAWVEYFVPGEGWKLLEVTPGAAEAPEEPETPETPETPEEPETPETPETPEEPEAPEPPAPETPAEPETPERERPAWLKPAVRALAVCAALAAWSGGVRLVRSWRFSSGTRQQRARRIYRELRAVSRLGRLERPARAEELALKARFSRGGVTPEELRELKRLFDAEVSRLKKRRPVWRVLAPVLLGL